MKKTTIISALLLLFAAGLNAQDFDSIMQPTHVVGLSYDSDGQTLSYPADFEYLEDGKLRRFLFDIPDYPDYNDRTSYWRYSGDFLRNKLLCQLITTSSENYMFEENYLLNYHDQGRLSYQEFKRYRRDNIWDASGYYFNYYYDQFKRVIRAEYGDITADDPIPVSTFWVYEYANRGKNVIKTQYGMVWNENAWAMVPYVQEVSTYLYDDEYFNISNQVDTYNLDGEITQSTIQSYTYNDQHQLESTLDQYLSDGEWVNSGMTLYAYDDDGHCIETIVKSWSEENNDWVNSTIGTKSFNDEGLITEDFSGVWSEEFQDWVPVNKTAFEYENDNTLYIVSFWKYEQDQWVHDTYKSQTVLFGKDLEKQQECVESMTYMNLNNHAPKIYYYQFEFTMERMKRPTYMAVEEDKTSSCAVYPNPGKDFVTVKAPVLNAVVRFYDLQGRLLYAQPFDFQTDVNAASWAPGLYLWEIWNGPNKEAAGKWVKE